MKPRWMRDEHWAIIMSRLLYCQPDEQGKRHPCAAGGFIAFGNIGHYQPLHDNYGLPCVGGTITYDDGQEVLSPRCIFCGSTG